MDWNKISSILINSLAQIQQPIEELSFDDVHELHGTGRSYQTGKRRYEDKGYTYRHGIQTKIGDIEISVAIDAYTVGSGKVNCVVIEDEPIEKVD